MSIGQMEPVQPLEKPIDLSLLVIATTAYFDVWNMRCSHCTVWVRNSLLRLEGVFVADVFLKQGVAAVTYDPAQLTTADLLEAIAAAGCEICHHYGAELIGQVPAAEALHLRLQ